MTAEPVEPTQGQTQGQAQGQGQTQTQLPVLRERGASASGHRVSFAPLPEKAGFVDVTFKSETMETAKAEPEVEVFDEINLVEDQPPPLPSSERPRMSTLDLKKKFESMNK